MVSSNHAQVAQPTTTGLTRPSQNSTTSNLSPERFDAWKNILIESAFALGREMLTGHALTAAVHAFERINAQVPTQLLSAVYLRSMTLTDAKGSPVYWDARAMNLAYWKLLEESDGRVTTINGRNLLPETASSVCPRCDGTNLERMPDGSRRPGCKHEYTSEEEEARIIVRDRELVKEKAAEMRAGLAKIVTMKAMPAVSVTESIVVTYTCTVCRRKVGSDFGWNYHDVCDRRIPGPVRDGERLSCRGVMEVL